MQEAPLHVYFYKKHAEPARQMAPVLRQMKKEGLLKKYKAAALNR